MLQLGWDLQRCQFRPVMSDRERPEMDTILSCHWLLMMSSAESCHMVQRPQYPLAHIEKAVSAVPGTPLAQAGYRAISIRVEADE
jgi:hypothetical protein